MVVFGTRPEAIKMCPLVNELKRREGLVCRVCITGQHREMLEQVLKIFAVQPDYDFRIMKPEQTLLSVTESILEKMEYVLDEEKPDALLVHGDTTTAFAAALSGFYKKIPIGHVEAGLRTGNLYSPYPEEFNRQAVDLISGIYFAPTKWAKQNLLLEGKKEEQIYVTGNTVIDAMAYTIKEHYEQEALQWAGSSRIILVTAHRRENIGASMEHMFRAIRKIAEELEDVRILFPVHMNPKVRQCAQKLLAGHERIRLIEPLDVLDFHNIMAKSYLILTDSGGVQEEASALGKPVLVMRNTTERPEGVDAGSLKLVGTDEETIYQETRRILSDRSEYERRSQSKNLYGDGHACRRIADILTEHFVKDMSYA